MTDADLKQLANLVEAAHSAPDDDAYLALVIDSLLALRDEQSKQTALLEALVESQRQMLQLAVVSLERQNTKPATKPRRVQQEEKAEAPAHA